MAHHDLRDAPGHLASTVRHLSSLVQGELELAKAEMKRNVSRATVGLVFFGIAALLALVALNVLASALVAALAMVGVPAVVAALLVGAGLLIVALVLSIVGKSRLSAEALSPSRTAANISRDIDTIKEASHA
ncbi:phage holin family protein [Thalassococcus sp. S3]|uniref:phage holin family protein n=1 Tax=Thalassococcus sp. S3 TaxID=2017482 RepID=UPI0010241221|nr:phage holin family protein [Thalassococcus sp. S3]QBF34000.1 hypothetical protein CFI11_22730 [Thalassococcus sp. S3]